MSDDEAERHERGGFAEALGRGGQAEPADEPAGRQPEGYTFVRACA
jgi:hypothetical protein